MIPKIIAKRNEVSQSIIAKGSADFQEALACASLTSEELQSIGQDEAVSPNSQTLFPQEGGVTHPDKITDNASSITNMRIDTFK